MVDCSRCQKTAAYKAAMAARPAPRSSEALSWVKGDVIRTPGGDLMLVSRDTFSNSWVGTWLADGKVARLYDDHPWVRDGRVQLVASGENQVKYGSSFEPNAAYVVSATIHEPEGQVTIKERFSSLEKALARAVELRDSSRPVGGPGRRSVIFVDRQRRGSARDLHLALSAPSRTWGLETASNEASEMLGSELHRQVGPTEASAGPAMPPGFEGFGDDVFEENAKKAVRYAPRTPPVGQRELLVDRNGTEWIVIPDSRLVEAEGERFTREWVEQRLGPLQPKLSTNRPRRYERNNSALAAAREIRRKFHDQDPEHETPVPWDWPAELQEIGTCEAVMYASAKWQQNPRKIIDYKHVAEGPQRILVRPGFVHDHRGNKALKVVGPYHELNDMPEAFAVLDKILGVQVRLYEGSDENPMTPNGDHGYYQIDIPGAYLGAAQHPETGETFLIVYTNDGVHCVIVGPKLGVEKDGIVG
jgi:hypothetical protein